MTAMILSIGFSSTDVLAEEQSPPPFDHEHAAWTAVLEKAVYVIGPVSKVDYAGLKSDPAPLDRYLALLSKVTQKEFDGFLKNEQIAFLINAYNAFTLKLIRDGYDENLRSIRDLGGFISSPWKKSFFSLLGEERNLDWIEHDTLRRKYGDNRVHFALNCASVGCPRLWNKAWRPQKLEELFEDACRAFLSDANRNRYDKASKTIYISKMFDWYKEDFGGNNAGIRSFVSKYMTRDPKIAEEIRMPVTKIEFLEYDWNLNAKK